MFPFIQKWTFYNIDILSVKSVESSFKLEIYMKSYVGKHLTPRGGSDFEGVGGI